MHKRDKDDIIFDIRAIDGVEDKVRRNHMDALNNLDDSLQKIGDALLFNVELKNDDSIDHTKNKMVINASTLMKKEEELVDYIVELVKILCKFGKTAYEPGYQPDIIPTSLIRMGKHWQYLSIGILESTMAANKLAMLSEYNISRSKPMIKNCCKLVIGACMLGKNAVIKNVWERLPETNHPDGMMGHTYDVLSAYDEKLPPSSTAKKFRSRFQEKADKYLDDVDDLEEKAQTLLKTIQSQSPTDKHAETAAEYLGIALEDLERASKLEKEASKFVENLPTKPKWQ